MGDRPYLVQRAKVKPPIIGKPEDHTLKVSELFDLDYMGSSEYEWGAVPKALRLWNGWCLDQRLQKTVKEYTHSTLRDRDGRVVYYLCTPELQPAAEKFLTDDSLGNNRLQEPTLFENYFKPREVPPPTRGKKKQAPQMDWASRNDFWFDLCVPYAVAFDVAHLRAFLRAVKNSVIFMDEQKKLEKVVKPN